MPAPSTTAYLLLDIAGTSLALPRRAIREILPRPHLHASPAAGGALAGFLNLSGEAVPVLDLALLLAIREETPLAPYQHILLTVEGDYGLLVDRVLDIVSVETQCVRPVDGSRTLNGCVDAEIVLGDRLVHGLSVSRLLTVEEKSRIADHARWATQRLLSLTPA